MVKIENGKSRRKKTVNDEENGEKGGGCTKKSINRKRKRSKSES